MGVATGAAAGRLWGDRAAWSAALLAAVAAAALRAPLLVVALLVPALLVAAWRPRWGALAVGAACLAVPPHTFGLLAIAVGAALAFVPRRPAAMRQGSGALALRMALWATALGLASLSFALPAPLAAGLGPALGLAAIAALACASLVAAIVAWRAQDGGRLSWSLAILVPVPLLALPALHYALAPAIAVIAAIAAVQAPVPLLLVTRSLQGRLGAVARVTLGVGWAGAIAILGWSLAS